MPVVGVDEIENYKGFQSDFDFLKLPKDKDYAVVRFYLNERTDIKFNVVHTVKTKTGKYRDVDCLRTFDEPVDDCPLCQAALKDKELALKTKLFLPVFVESINGKEVNKTMIFQRGKTFVEELEPVIRRFAPLAGVPCEIERNGIEKSMETVYKIVADPRKQDDKTNADLPEVPELLGTYIMQLTFEDMVDFLKTGELPATEETAEEDKAENLPRRTKRDTPAETAKDDAATQRRTARAGRTEEVN